MQKPLTNNPAPEWMIKAVGEISEFLHTAAIRNIGKINAKGLFLGVKGSDLTAILQKHAPRLQEIIAPQLKLAGDSQAIANSDNDPLAGIEFPAAAVPVVAQIKAAIQKGGRRTVNSLARSLSCHAGEILAAIHADGSGLAILDGFVRIDRKA